MSAWATAILVAITLYLAWQGWATREAEIAQRNRVEEQTIYLCTVAQALDPIALRASKVASDPIWRSEFLSLHIVLSETDPCQEVEG